MSEQLEMFQQVNGLAGYKEAIKPFPLAGRNHPATSHKAAKQAKPRANSQRIKILSLYRSHVDLTSEEVGHISGLIKKPGACYWVRVSELNKLGLIEATGHERAGESGANQTVYRITNAGRDLLRDMGL